ncbi:MAG: ribosome maturation factor RimP [Candidatus Izemoplasmatales bacterium]
MDLTNLKKEVETFLKNTPYDLYDIEYIKNQKDPILRIYIDSLKDIDMDMIVDATNLLNPFIDKIDPIAGEYILEVSSPGAEKELRSIEHIKKAVGRQVYLETYEQKLEGKLLSFDGKDLTILTSKNKKIKIDYIDVNLIRLAIKF